MSTTEESLPARHGIVPPLFAESVCEDLVSRIRSALRRGDHAAAGELLTEAQANFPDHAAFRALQKQQRKQAGRETDFETAIAQANAELKDDRFVLALAKYREAITLSRGIETWEETAFGSLVAGADTLISRNWRVAQALLDEASQFGENFAVPQTLWSGIQREESQELIENALSEADSAGQGGDLAHTRDRIAALFANHPNDSRLEARLAMLDQLLADRLCGEERSKSLQKLIAFRDNLDRYPKAEPLLDFAKLAEPVIGPHQSDLEFIAIVNEVAELAAQYQAALTALPHDPAECARLCDAALSHRPANQLLLLLKEKANAREWVQRLASETLARAREFESGNRYSQALEELSALRAIDPDYPGLEALTCHCEQQLEFAAPLPEPDLPIEEPLPLPVPEAIYAFAPPRSTWAPHLRARILITKDAWELLKAGLVATAALMLTGLAILSARH